MTIRFSGRFLLFRLSLWTLIGACGVTLVVYPDWASDTPIVRFLPNMVLQGLALLSLTYPVRVLWRLARIIIHRLPALTAFDGEMVVRADLLLRQRTYPWGPTDTIAEHLDRQLIRLGHDGAWIVVPRAPLNRKDLANALEASRRP